MSVNSYQNCVDCGGSVGGGVFLSNGMVIHDLCLRKIVESDRALLDKIDGLSKEIYLKKRQIEKADSFISNLYTFFLGKENSELLGLMEEKKRLVIGLEKAQSQLQKWRLDCSIVYDFLPYYPPDWDVRRSRVLEKGGGSCSKCNSIKALHIHHLVPLSEGGSNRLGNLVLLCEQCHKKEHHNRFSNSFIGQRDNDKQSLMAQKVSIINHAVRANKNINFRYRKFNTKRYENRSIRPERFKKVEWESGRGYTLCVTGFCYLRSANRTFAVKRMNSIVLMED